MINKISNIVWSIFSILIILSYNSCIPILDPEPCDTPIKKTIGFNNEFSITPLKNNYNIGEKIKVLFVIDNIANIPSSNDEFNLYENTNDQIAEIHYGFEDHQDLAKLIADSFNSINVNFGSKNEFSYEFTYDSTLRKYLLELEITLQTKKTYEINDFSLYLILGSKPSFVDGDNCNFYEHKATFKLDSPISFEVG